MADVKITALPPVTLPLDGTEDIPLVQGGTSKQVQASDILPIIDYTDTTPTSPNTGLRVFTRHRARRLLAGVGPSGQDTRYQPFIASNRVALWQAINGATTSTTMGAAFTALNNATATPTAVSVATTNFYTSMVRERFATPATAGGGAGLRSATAQWMLSATANMGGFHYVCRFGLNTAASGTRGFFGLSSQTGAYAAGTNPSAQLNQVGFYWDAAQTNIRFITAGTAVGTADLMGNAFNPTTPAATYFYEAAIFCPSGAGQSGYYAITRLNDGVLVTGTFGSVGATALTTMPLPSVLLSAHAFYGNGTLAAAHTLDVQSLYVESDN